MRRNPFWSEISRRVLAVLLVSSSADALAQGALRQESLIEYIRSRDDLSGPERAAWERLVKIKFGGAAMDEDNKTNTQITVAKAIISSAIFMEADPKKAVDAAFEGYRGALGFVPPPLAIHYNLLALQGRKPKGTQEQLTFDFPKYYSDELAPELVAYWEKALREGTIPDYVVEETKEALEKTRVKMRPLLADKLRLLAKLAKARTAVSAAQRTQIEKDIREIEEELQRSFTGVPIHREVVDASRPPFERLKTHLRDIQETLTTEDLELDPASPSTSAPPSAEPRPSRTTPAEDPPGRDDSPPRDPPRNPGGATGGARPPTGTRPEARPPATTNTRPEARPPVTTNTRPEARPPATTNTRPDTRPPATTNTRPEARPPDRGAPHKRVGRAEVEPKLKTTIHPWLGTPYLWGGDQKVKGTDCSGFTRGVTYEGFTVQLPRVSRDQYRTGQAIDAASLEPGDLIFFDMKDVGQINHVGIYAGNGKFAHAGVSKGVVYVDFNKKLFQKAYRGARRVLQWN